MNLETIKDTWGSLITSDKLSYLTPLFGIEIEFNLKPIELVNKIESHELRTYTKFPEIGIDELNNLRIYAQNNTINSSNEYWIYKLIKFCEIRISELKKSKNRFTNYSEEGALKIILIQSLFLDLYYTRKDIRYLNTSLKLDDIDWVENWNQHEPIQHLTVRNLLLIENALLKLKK